MDPGAAGPSENEQTLASYETAAELYRLRAKDQVWPERDAFLEAVADLAPRGHVLELGSGPGLDARLLESMRLRVDRSDGTAAFVELLRADGYPARLLNVITDDLGGPYDLVYANAMLLHLPLEDFRAVLRKARAAATALAFTVKEGDGERWTTARLGVPRWYRYWRADELRREVEDAGWRVLSLTRSAGKRDDWLQVLAT